MDGLGREQTDVRPMNEAEKMRKASITDIEKSRGEKTISTVSAIISFEYIFPLAERSHLRSAAA